MKNILLIVLVGCLMSFKIYSTEGTSISIIVHKDNPVASLTAAEAKLYWLRKIKKRWPEINKNIRPAGYKTNNAAQTAFYGTVLKMSSSDVDTYFTQKQYESADKPQDKLATDADMVAFVAGEPGAIGFIETSALSAGDKGKVKVVLVVE
jgi:ABC-type phosphate transport system substrate-binding protein